MGCTGSKNEVDLVLACQRIEDNVKLGTLYQIGPLLGRGSFSKVYEATLIENPDERVAIKKLSLLTTKVDPKETKKKNIVSIHERLQDPNIDPWEKEVLQTAVVGLQKEVDNATKATKYDDIMKEVNVMKECNHPHIMGVKDVFKGPSTVCIALTRCYSDLSSLVDSRRSPLRDENDILRFTRHLLKAVSYLHDEKRIIHRDIKPANCSLTHVHLPHARLLLADFGLSAHLPDDSDFLPEGEKVAGTVAYLSPEAFAGRTGKPADVWASGCVLYELMMCQEFAVHLMIFSTTQDGKLFVYESEEQFRHSLAKLLRKKETIDDIVKRSLSPDELKSSGQRAHHVDRAVQPEQLSECLRKLLAPKVAERISAAQGLRIPLIGHSMRSGSSGGRNGHSGRHKDKTNPDTPGFMKESSGTTVVPALEAGTSGDVVNPADIQISADSKEASARNFVL
mmetsp:Transcript_43167/g.101461  ORF Transcript_43167/g.101461 Transcript_43167/m.101461 type:complete len:452 (-) Transcript_43167:130-1485(-)